MAAALTLAFVGTPDLQVRHSATGRSRPVAPCYLSLPGRPGGLRIPCGPAARPGALAPLHRCPPVSTLQLPHHAGLRRITTIMHSTPRFVAATSLSAALAAVMFGALPARVGAAGSSCEDLRGLAIDRGRIDAVHSVSPG